MGRWVHHNAITNMLFGVEFIEYAVFLNHSKATNNLKVHWLRPQTHMEWFPLPFYTPFIWSGWADGSTLSCHYQIKLINCSYPEGSFRGN